MTPKYFTHEPAVMAALSAIPGLLVRRAVAGDEAVELSAVDPVAVVVFETDETVQATKTACLVNRRVSVYLLLQGAVDEYQPEDDTLMAAIFDALHGLEIPGYDEPLYMESSDAEVVSGCRDYRIVFKTQTTLRRPGRPR